MFSLYDPNTLVQAFALSRQGSSHRRATPEKPCQDACGVFSGAFRGEGALAVVAADGHGSAPHDRSDLGAQFAAQTAGAVFLDFALRLVEAPPARLAAEFREHFPRQVVARWREKVEAHARERGDGTGASGPTEGEDLWRRYGTTLLFAGFFRRYVFLAQLGDGVLVVQRADGTLDCPMPVDSSHFGGRTYSLSAADARTRFQVELFAQEELAGVLLCTDGITDAFDEREKMLRMLLSILENRRTHGLGPSTDLLPGFLDRASTYGSGDDVTIAGLVLHAVAVQARSEPEVAVEVKVAPQETAAASEVTVPEIVDSAADGLSCTEPLGPVDQETWTDDDKDAVYWCSYLE